MKTEITRSITIGELKRKVPEIEYARGKILEMERKVKKY